MRSKNIWTWPAMRSFIAGPAPRYGLSAAEKRQPQQWFEKSVSRLCPGEMLMPVVVGVGGLLPGAAGFSLARSSLPSRVACQGTPFQPGDGPEAD